MEVYTNNHITLQVIFHAVGCAKLLFSCTCLPHTADHHSAASSYEHVKSPVIVAAAIRAILSIELLAFRVPCTLSPAFLVIWFRILDNKKNSTLPCRCIRVNWLLKTASDDIKHMSSSLVTGQNTNLITRLSLHAHVGDIIKHLTTGRVAR